MLLGLTPEQLPEPERLLAMLGQVKADQPNAQELRSLIVDAIGRSRTPSAGGALRKVADADPDVRLAAIRHLARRPEAANLPYLLLGLGISQANSPSEFFDALKKNPGKPKADDAKAFRTLLEAARKLPPNQKWKAVEVLRLWTGGKSFGAEKESEWKSELAAWGLWYLQTFPSEPALPDVASDRPAESKYKFADLKAYLEKDPRGQRGDAQKGKAAFGKALCIKCHRFGSEGEGLGPDLSAVAKRFKRAEILESIVDPSKVISDQFRSSQISTLDGRTFVGLAVEMGDNITILLNDGSKAMIKKSEVESRIASLVSLMPEKLLDELTLEEISDLFAYLESAAPK
jgi:putative heme-binding domain-containing protein